MLLKTPGFSAVVALTLALGIGANAALFSVVNGVLLNPLPYPQPEQLVSLHQSKPNSPTGTISYPNFLDWQKENQTFSAMAVSRGASFALVGAGEAERVSGRRCTANLFSVLGVKPALGRDFAPGEDEPGAGPVVLISAELWQRKFNAAPDAPGKSMTVDDRSYTIVGVLPASFTLYRGTDVYVPMGQWGNRGLQNRSAGLGLQGIGRLKQGVTLAQAQADLDGVMRRLAEAYPETNRGNGAALIPLKERLVGDVGPSLWMLLGAVGFVLLIACVNVSNLLLARATSRTREFAIRAALGAGQWRLLRQSLTESILLALAGGGLGLLLAALVTRAASQRAAYRVATRGRDWTRCAGFALHRSHFAAHGRTGGSGSGAEDLAVAFSRNAQRRRARRGRRTAPCAGRPGRCGAGAGAGLAHRRRPDDPHYERALER